MVSEDNRKPKTVTQLVHTFTSFLLVCIHTILYHRNLYPATTFLTTRAYNYPVAQSRHPAVCQWISDAIAAVAAQLLRPKDDSLSPTGKGDVGGWVERVVLVIFSEEAEVMERYVFDVRGMPRVPAKEIDTNFVREDAAERAKFVPPGEVPMDLSAQFRATLAQITAMGTRLAPLPPNCTFSLAIELGDEADPPVGHPQQQDWIAVEPGLQRRAGEAQHGNVGGGRFVSSESGSEDPPRGSNVRSATESEPFKAVKTVPVRKVDASEILFELWIEEGAAKEIAAERAQARPSSSAEDN